MKETEMKFHLGLFSCHRKPFEFDLSVLPYFDAEKIQIEEHVAEGTARFFMGEKNVLYESMGV